MKTIIFDFDGTIANSLPIGVEIINELADKYDYKHVSDSDVEKFRGMKVLDILKEMDISLPKVTIIGHDLMSIARERANQVKVFENMKELIDALRAQGKKVGIITKTDLRIVRKVLSQAGIKVDFLKQDKTMFAKEKTIEEVLKERNLVEQDVIFVGDEVRDIEAAKKAGLDIISVSWGYNNRAIIEEHNSVIVDTPKELLKILKAL